MTTRKRSRKQDDELLKLDEQVGRAEKRDSDGELLKLDEVERESAVR